MGHSCVCLCRQPFSRAPLGSSTLPHDPPTMWTGTELLSAHGRQANKTYTLAHTPSPTRVRRDGAGTKGTARDTPDRGHHHRTSSFVVTLEISPCRFPPSLAYSESCPRGGCAPCPVHSSTWPGYIDATQKAPVSLSIRPCTHPLPGSRSLTVYEPARPPVRSPLPLIVSSLRTLSTTATR